MLNYQRVSKLWRSKWSKVSDEWIIKFIQIWYLVYNGIIGDIMNEEHAIWFSNMAISHPAFSDFPPELPLKQPVFPQIFPWVSHSFGSSEAQDQQPVGACGWRLCRGGHRRWLGDFLMVISTGDDSMGFSQGRMGIPEGLLFPKWQLNQWSPIKNGDFMVV